LRYETAAGVSLSTDVTGEKNGGEWLASDQGSSVITGRTSPAVRHAVIVTNVTEIRVLGVLPCLSRAGLGHIFIVGYSRVQVQI
jgi:hypothetical protein